MNKSLSHKLKLLYLPFLIKLDGACCFYCKIELFINKMIFEHLNGDRSDNRRQNIVIACQSCNIKKITDSDLQIIAKEKLKENEDRNFLSERDFVEDKEPQTGNTEIDISVSSYNIVEKYITEVIQTDGSILKSKAINSGAYLCKKQTGHGSKQSTRNYIDILTSEEALFMITRDEHNKNQIVKRNGN